MAKKNTDYRRVVQEGDTIFLYAPIGEGYAFEGGQQINVGITSNDFITALNVAAVENAVVKVRLNSNGGSTTHGAAIMAAMTNSSAEIHTYNDGTAASMAAAIWAMGKKRYMAKNAILMLHNPSAYVEGNAQDMRQMADTLDKIAESMILGLAEATGQTADEIKAKYFADYTDKFLSYADVQADNLITPGEDYAAGTPAPSADIVASLAKDPFREFAPEATASNPVLSILTQIRNFLSPRPGDAPAENITNVNKEELKAALTAGTLTSEDVQAILAEIAPPPTPQTPPADPTALDQLQAKMSALETALTTATAKIAELGAQPGAGKSTPGAPPADAPQAETKVDALAEFNKTMEAAAAEGMVRFAPSVKS